MIRADPDSILTSLRRNRDTGLWTRTPHLRMPARHDVRPSDISLRRLKGTLRAAADRAPRDFVELLSTPGVGPRTVAALAFVAEVVHGAPCRFDDPARFSLAHGGKDGHPFPVPLSVYDETIRVLRTALDRARLGDRDRLAAIRRLDAQARAVEHAARWPTMEQFMRRERALSSRYGGTAAAASRSRTAPPPRSRASTNSAKRQPGLF